MSLNTTIDALLVQIQTRCATATPEELAYLSSAIEKIGAKSTIYDLQNMISTMLTSTVLTGIPTAPTAPAGTNTTQIATTEFVTNLTQINFQIITTSYNANTRDHLFCDTSSGTSFTITLPSNPNNNDFIVIEDGRGTFNYCPVIINGNNKQIMGSSDNLILDVKNASIKLIYNSTLGWRVI